MSNEINIPKKRGRKPKNHNEESTKINETNNDFNNEINNQEINETNNEVNNEK